MRLVLSLAVIAACGSDLERRAAASNPTSTPNAGVSVVNAAGERTVVSFEAATINEVWPVTVSSFGRGQALALSGDSTVLAVGAWSRPSAENPRAATDFTGAAYVYTYQAQHGWRHTTTLEAPYAQAGMGRSVALDAAGDTLVIGAMGVDSARFSGSSPAEHGVAFVYERDATGWTESTRLQSEPKLGLFGSTLSLSSDGNVLAIGAPKEDAGAVYVFHRRGAEWARAAHLRGARGDEGFGRQIALSADAKTLVVGVPLADNNYGVAYVYDANGEDWKSRARLTGGGATANYFFGASIALSRDGQHLAVGATTSDGAMGGVHLYALGEGATQAGYLTTESDTNDAFGDALAWSDNGSVLLVGADHGAKMDGRVYRYERGAAWKLTAILESPERRLFFGQGLLLTGDGGTSFVCAQGEAALSGSVFVIPHRRWALE